MRLERRLGYETEELRPQRSSLVWSGLKNMPCYWKTELGESYQGLLELMRAQWRHDDANS